MMSMTQQQQPGTYPRALPTINHGGLGYTLDVRLREFRLVRGREISFMPFDTELGEDIINEICRRRGKDNCAGCELEGRCYE